MTRRRYLITYDIADDKRRTKVFKALFANADHTQFSVFVGDFDDRELVEIRGELATLIKDTEDQVLIADLGSAEHEAGKIIAHLGKPYAPPIRALVI